MIKIWLTMEIDGQQAQINGKDVINIIPEKHEKVSKTILTTLPEPDKVKAFPLIKGPVNRKRPYAPAKTGIKTCPDCNNEYKPTSNAQMRCEPCAEVKKKAKR